MRILRFMILMLVTQGGLLAQDADFSQYYATPLSLNPALTGTFNGTYRVGAIYRDAWRVVSPVPIATYAFNGEYRFLLGNEKKKSDYGAAGLKFFSDRTSLIEQNTNALSVSFAFHKALSQYTNQYLSLGFETGLIQKNINYENLFFEDQFNNVNGFEGETIEDLQANNFAVADFGIGLNYSNEFSKKHSMFLGFTTKHLSNPNVSFWKKSDNNDPDLVKVNRLPLLFGVQASTKHQLNYRISIFPRIIAQVQGSHIQSLLGSTIRYDLLSNNKTALHTGLFVRASNSVSGLGIAHVTSFAGFEVSNMLLGISYDINMRDVVNQAQGLGVFEISVSYTGEVIEDSAFCPQF